MKIKLSISMDSELMKLAEAQIKEGSFRNKSHIVEYALKSFLRKEKITTSISDKSLIIQRDGVSK